MLNDKCSGIGGQGSYLKRGSAALVPSETTALTLAGTARYDHSLCEHCPYGHRAQRSNGGPTALSHPSPKRRRRSSVSQAIQIKVSSTVSWHTHSAPWGVQHSISPWSHREAWTSTGMCHSHLTVYASMCNEFFSSTCKGMCVRIHPQQSTRSALTSHFYQRPWDVCAGIVIAQEAGGIVTGSQQRSLPAVLTRRWESSHGHPQIHRGARYHGYARARESWLSIGDRLCCLPVPDRERKRGATADHQTVLDKS